MEIKIILLLNIYNGVFFIVESDIGLIFLQVFRNLNIDLKTKPFVIVYMYLASGPIFQPIPKL